MTVLAAGWQNMGGRTLRYDVADGQQGDVITHPLNGPLPAETGYQNGVYNISRWTNKTAVDFPDNLGAQAGHALGDTLAAAFAATPV